MLGGDRELVVTAGNHDHLMVCTWLDARALREPAPAPLAAEQRFDPAEASPMLAQIARWAAPARVTVAYPGLWVRPDVYATHGHFLDAHLTVPTLERIGRRRDGTTARTSLRRARRRARTTRR